MFSSLSAKCTVDALVIDATNPCVAFSGRFMHIVKDDEICQLESIESDFNSLTYQLNANSTW